MFRLDHIQLAIPTGAEDACRVFWGDLLGFDEIKKPEKLRTRGGAWFGRDGIEVHLGVETDFSPAKRAHPAFRITGLDSFADRLASAGHPIRWDDRIKSRRRFFTDDPFGNRIEFIEE